MTETDSETVKAPKRIFFYVQHLLGIGHLVRASRIAAALHAAGMEVTLVTGGNPIEGFPGPNVRHVQLPAVLSSSTGFSGLIDADGRRVDERFEARRAALLIEAFQAAAPDAVLIEAFPFGRRQMRFELLPLLEAIRQASPRPLLYSSVRDILQENRKPGRDRETADLVVDYFDGVLIHGDPQFVRLEDTFPLAGDIAGKVHYTGLVAPQTPVPSPDRFDVVVSAGGGAVGAALVEAALDARDILSDDRSWCLIAGPNMPAEAFDRLSARADKHVALVRFRTDFPSLLMNAELSISQAGYNTVCDLLLATCGCVLVPFASGGETEQTMRAEKLASLGFAEVVGEQQLSGETLAAAIGRVRQRPARPQISILMDGAETTTALIGQQLDARAAASGS
ncbi:glycosyltransferase family protein [Rhizobium sp. SGZ-381]|uniref:glycosyltransferase family protein n=1 Tax=Rhizobium sp. SGZ-381 TaxID=3342800 RepID=UPI0036725340